MKKFLYILTLQIFLLLFTGVSCGMPSKDIKTGGVFKSVDRGSTWEQKVKIEKKKTIASVSVLSMAIDPHNSKVIYIGTENRGIYKTENSGDSWRQLAINNGSVNSIALDPKSEGIVYAVNSGKVFKSTDGGAQWQMIYIESGGGTINTVTVDSYDSKNIYTGTSNGGFLKSADCGNSWSILKWFDSSIKYIVINPNDTRQIYVVTAEKFYKTNDSGLSWENISENLKDFKGADKINCIYVKNEVYLGTEAGLLKSADAGVSWESLRILIPPKKPLITSITVSPENSREIYFSSGATLFRSLDGGLNWQVVQLPTSRRIEVIKIDPENPDIIYIGVKFIKEKKKGFLPYQPAPPK